MDIYTITCYVVIEKNVNTKLYIFIFTYKNMQIIF